MDSSTAAKHLAFWGAAICGIMSGGCAAEADLQPSVAEEIGVSALAFDVGDFVSIESYNFPGHYLRHRNGLGELTAVSSDLDRADATFRLTSGLANSSCISFEASNFPGYYLRHQDARLKLHPFANEDLYKNDATFCIVPALQPGLGSPWISFRSYNYPSYYIRHEQGHFYIGNQGGPFRADATFRFVSPR
jgi:hypothetical protein